jgi:hypothetical protein
MVYAESAGASASSCTPVRQSPASSNGHWFGMRWTALSYSSGAIRRRESRICAADAAAAVYHSELFSVVS